MYNTCYKELKSLIYKLLYIYKKNTSAREKEINEQRM